MPRHGGFSKPGQNIYWISDQDAMFANEVRSKDTAAILARFAGHYARHRLGELGVGTTGIDPGDRHEEDLNSIPDLMSGAVAEVATALAQKCGGHIPWPMPLLSLNTSFSTKADIIYQWICDSSYALRRAVMVIDRVRSGGLVAFKLDMQEDSLRL